MTITSPVFLCFLLLIWGLLQLYQFQYFSEWPCHIAPQEDQSNTIFKHKFLNWLNLTVLWFLRFNFESSSTLLRALSSWWMSLRSWTSRWYSSSSSELELIRKKYYNFLIFPVSHLSPTIFLVGNVGAGAGLFLLKTFPNTLSFLSSFFDLSSFFACLSSLAQLSSSLSSNLTTVSPCLLLPEQYQSWNLGSIFIKLTCSHGLVWNFW